MCISFYSQSFLTHFFYFETCILTKGIFKSITPTYMYDCCLGFMDVNKKGPFITKVMCCILQNYNYYFCKKTHNWYHHLKCLDILWVLWCSLPDKIMFFYNFITTFQTVWTRLTPKSLINWAKPIIVKNTLGNSF